MGLLTYDVAVSLDGFIAGPNDDVSLFPVEGEHVDLYFARLSSYQAVLMGRKTYEFGYSQGLEPGQAPYPNMDHFVLSGSLLLPDSSEVTIVANDAAKFVESVKEKYDSVYLCGGGAVAGFLLNKGLIDCLCLKVAPVLLGHGTRLFDGLERACSMNLEQATTHANGVHTMVYGIN